MHFIIANALKTSVVQGNVKNLNINNNAFYGNRFVGIFLPKSLKDRIPRDFIEKHKIIFYNTTDDGTLHLKVNDLRNFIILGDKKNLETLGEDFQNAIK